MLTINIFEKIKQDIKRLNDAPRNYYRLKEEKEETTILFLLSILLSPLTIIFDLLLLPFELLYLIVYKMLWKNLRSDKYD